MKTVKWVTQLIVGLAVILSPHYAHANAIYTYAYTGNAYDSFYVGGSVSPDIPPDPYDAYNKVTARFTIEELLQPSYSGEVIPSSFVISDGDYTITQDNEPNTCFRVDTDSDGNISYWMFGAQALLMLDSPHAVSIISNFVRDMSLDVVCGNSPDYELIIMCHESTPSGYLQEAWVVDNPGVWTVSQVPEPTTIFLLGLGLFGLVGFRKKFSKK